MSGRKAGEVTQLLKQGANTRSAGAGNFARNLQDFMHTVPANEKTYNGIYTEIQQAGCDFSAEAQKECSDECTQLEKRLNNLKQSLKSLSSDVSFAKHKEAEYEKQFASLDAEAERIHRSVRNKSHYCDSEYAQANKLLQKYKNLTSQQKQEEAQFKSRIAASNQAVTHAKMCQKQLAEITAAAAAVNKKAHDIVHLRKEAASARSFIQAAADSIEKDKAEKFLPEQYQAILAEIQIFLNGNDNAIVAGFTALQNKVSLFKQELDGRYAAFVAAKTAAESDIEETYKLLTKDAFYDPLEYAKKQDNAPVLHLFDFLNSYAGGEFVTDINGYFKQARDALAQEQFTTVHTLLSQASPLIAQAAEKAALVQEEKLRAIYNMINLRDALMSLNYKVKMEMADGGIKVTASAGDEKLVMETGDDGGLKIDHQESVSGSCAATWKQIQTACKEHDFLLQDVKKNGKSVIYDTPAGHINTAAAQDRARG